jgi:hypothetical protein
VKKPALGAHPDDGRGWFRTSHLSRVKSATRAALDCVQPHRATTRVVRWPHGARDPALSCARFATAIERGTSAAGSWPSPGSRDVARSGDGAARGPGAVGARIKKRRRGSIVH